MDWNEIKICRICLSTNCSFQSVFSSPDPLALEYSYSASYSDMIESVTSISIKPNDKLPLQICFKCIKDVLIAFNFQKLASSTQETLQSLQLPEYEKETDPLFVNVDLKLEDIKGQLLIFNTCELEPTTFEVNTLNPGNNISSIIIKPNTQIGEVNNLQAENLPEIKTFQIENNFGKRVMSPPPLVFLSKSKETPPPLVYLPKKVKKELICNYCKMVYSSQLDLKAHILSTHDLNSKKNNSCNLCGESPKDLLLHLGEHFKYLYCNKCNIKFNAIEKYENHMKEHLNSKKTSSFVLEQHKTTHDQKELTLSLCFICGQRSDRNDNICNLCINDLQCPPEQRII